jgi:hypothetical protein
MTEKNEYAASIRSKGCDNTGITEEIAKKMYNTLERGTYAIVRLKHVRQINDTTAGRKVELVIEEIEPSQDPTLDEHLQQLMRTIHQNRVLHSDGQQLTIDGPDDLEPSVEQVIKARQGSTPHVFDPSEDGDDCIVCGEDLDHQLHALLDDPDGDGAAVEHEDEPVPVA